MCCSCGVDRLVVVMVKIVFVVGVAGWLFGVKVAVWIVVAREVVFVV